MRLITIASFVMLLLHVACSSPQTSDQPGTPLADSTVFYPFVQYIEEQMTYVDSTPLAIEKLSFLNGKMVDSAIIGRDEFNQLASAFLETDPNQANNKAKFSEQSFQDLSIDALTFSITATTPDTRLRQATVLLHPETKKVKHVMLKLEEGNADSTVSSTLLWKHKMYFQQSSTIQYSNGQTAERVIKVVWDKPLD
jgi:hypothetical protein